MPTATPRNAASRADDAAAARPSLQIVGVHVGGASRLTSHFAATVWLAGRMGLAARSLPPAAALRRPAPARRLVYLGALAALPGSIRSIAVRLAPANCLTLLVWDRHDLLQPRLLALFAVAAAMRLGPVRQRLGLMSLRQGARAALMRLGGRMTATPDGQAVEAALARHLAAQHPDQLRLSPADGLGLAAQADTPALAAELRCLAEIACAVDARALAGRLADTFLTPDASDPAPVRAALAGSAGGGTALGAHLAACTPGRKADTRAWLLATMLGPLPRACSGPVVRVSATRAAAAVTGGTLNAEERAWLAGALGEPPASTPSAALGKGTDMLTRGEWLAALVFGAPRAVTGDDAAAPWRSAALRHWLQRRAGLLQPLLGTPRSGPVAAGPVLCGPALTGGGLDRSFWDAWDALCQAGLTPRLAGLTIGDDLPAVADAPHDRPGPEMVIHHGDPAAIPAAILTGFRHRRAYHIGCLDWPFEALPEAYRLALAMLDEIWVPSRFVARACRRHTDRPVLVMSPGLALPKTGPGRPPRGPRPGQPARLVVCLDEAEPLARGNPLAAVEAFRAAFAQRRDLQLMVSTGGTRGGDPEGQIARIAALAARDRRIALMTTPLPPARQLDLIASATALVSPHRTTGFGLAAARATALGVPVIATAHGGVADFCQHDTGFPVPARLVPVARGLEPRDAPGARWAEIDRAALAAAMRAVIADPAAARGRASLARSRHAPGWMPGAFGARQAARLVAIAAEQAALTAGTGGGGSGSEPNRGW